MIPAKKKTVSVFPTHSVVQNCAVQAYSCSLALRVIWIQDFDSGTVAGLVMKTARRLWRNLLTTLLSSLRTILPKQCNFAYWTSKQQLVEST